MISDSDRTFTVDDLMTRWSCSRKSVLDMIHGRVPGKKLAAFKIGRRAYRITEAEVRRIEQPQ